MTGEGIEMDVAIRDTPRALEWMTGEGTGMDVAIRDTPRALSSAARAFLLLG